MTLIWLYDPQALQAELPRILHGTQRALKFSDGDMNLSRVYNEIASGQVQAWMGVMEGERIGYLLTKIQEVQLGDRWLLIYMLFSLPGQRISDESYVEGFKELDVYCKKMGCTRMEFYTLRDMAFERHLKDHGWKRGYTKFSREVQ